MAASNENQSPEKTKEKVDMSNFDWITLQNQIDGKYNSKEKFSEPISETGWERGKRRMKEHPLVPIGMVTTATVLVIGVGCFLTKRSLYINDITQNVFWSKRLNRYTQSFL